SIRGLRRSTARALPIGWFGVRPVRVEIVAHAPSEFFHCMHCEFVWHQAGFGRAIHAEQRTSSLPPEMAEEYARIGEWAQSLIDRHGSAIELHVVDVMSPQGL